MDTKKIIRIAIFASGNGSNAKKIIDYFYGHPFIQVALIVCNNPGAGVCGIAAENNIPVLLINKENFFRGSGYADELKAKGIHFIVLAGFLWKIPAKLVQAYAGRVINIHPALLPKYGGKGMYGNAVHEAVIAAREKESGITVHLVDELYDNGKIIFQETCPVLSNDTAPQLAERIHTLEYNFFSRIIEAYIAGFKN